MKKSVTSKPTEQPDEKKEILELLDTEWKRLLVAADFEHDEQKRKYLQHWVYVVKRASNFIEGPSRG